MQLVADQIAEFLGQSARELRRNVEILVLFLAQPSERAGKKHPVAPLLRAVRTRTVQSSTHPDEHRARRHLARRDLIRARLTLSRPAMAARDEIGRAVGRGEIAYRPHARKNQ